MFGPFRTAGKVDERPKLSYPRLVVEDTKNRLVEIEKGTFVVEEMIFSKDSLGGDRTHWSEAAKFKTEETGYQSPIPPRTIIWLVKLLEQRI